MSEYTKHKKNCLKLNKQYDKVCAKLEILNQKAFDLEKEIKRELILMEE